MDSNWCRCGSCLCCGLCAAFVHPVEDHNASSQSSQVLGSSNVADSVPVALHPPLEIRVEVQARDGGNEKVETSQSNDAIVQPNGSELQQECALKSLNSKQGIDEATKISQKLDELEDNIKNPALMSVVEEEDICPTCLEGYDAENPKINTVCKHHFHLACILEWAERRPTCPVCDKEMVFNENL